MKVIKSHELRAPLQIVKEPLQANQFTVATLLDDGPSLEHLYAVRILDRVDAVGDAQSRL